MKYKIAVFVDAFFPYCDGVVNVVHNYYSRLSKYFDITVFTPDYKTDYVDNFAYKVFRVKSVKIPNTENFLLPLPNSDEKLKDYLKNNNFDIVHAHSPFYLGKFGIEYAKKNNIYSIFSLHSQYKFDFKLLFKSNLISNFLTKKFIVNLLVQVDEIWTVNKAMERLLLDDYDKDKLLINKIFKVFSNATEFARLSEFKVNKNKILVNDEYHFSSKDFIITYIGRITKQKNILLMLKVIYDLKNVYQNFKFLIVGKGEFLKKAKKFVKKKNLDNWVIFTGGIYDRKQLEKIICRTDLSIFLSEYDANTLTKFEMASQAKPMMFLNSSITSWGIKKDVDGYLVEKNPLDISLKIKHIIQTRNDKIVGENSYKNIYVTWDEVVEKVKKEYNLIFKIIKPNKT